ncbi:hypothetical protein LIER_08704 [Lithospermum erythrorhizon]|uniref:Envelope-like protein n=1 Tax=Lithospermum erythrorhizon TaxID=34254 RepID=A0AAV3PD49_LITER
MVKTRRSLNMSERATKGKKKGVGTSDNTCIMVEPPIVNKEAQKTKGRKSKIPVSTSMEEEQVFSPTPIRSIPPIDTSQEEVVDVSDPPANPSVKDTMGKTANPSVVAEKSVDDVGKDVPKRDGKDVLQADEIVTEGVKSTSDVDLGKNVEPSVEDTIHGLKDGSSSGGDVLKPLVDDCVKDNVAEGMDADIPNVVDTEPVTAKAVDEGVDDILDGDIQEVIPEDVGPKKKSKKRKYKKSADAGGAVDTWSDKGLPSSKLIVKYAVLDKVGVANWVPTTHTTSVSQTFASILESQKEDILTVEDVEGPAPGFITISPKLIQGTHVADIPPVTVDTGGASGSGTDESAKILRDEIRHLDGIIQSSLARKYVLEAHLRSLSGEDNPDVEPAVGDGGVETPPA